MSTLRAAALWAEETLGNGLVLVIYGLVRAVELALGWLGRGWGDEAEAW